MAAILVATAYAAATDVSEGPYIADSAVVTLLDRSDPGGDCASPGPLVFGCLIQALSTSQAHEPPSARSPIRST